LRDYAQKKWSMRGSQHTDNLASPIRFQVSGFGCQEGEALGPET